MIKRPKLSKAYSERGAQVGRRDVLVSPTDAPVKFYLYEMKLYDGDYDEGGAYWGFKRGTRMFHAYSDGGDRVFVRAHDRAQAKYAVRWVFPNATFYR